MKKVGRICIVGGGSAGWLTAALLYKNLPQVKICLIESANNPIIGVGEATLLSFRPFMEACGFSDESYWMNRCEAIYKSGILFKDWMEENHQIWHPFTNIPHLNSHLHLADVFRDSNFSSIADFFKYSSANFDNCVIHNKVSSDRGYHLNAVKLAEFLSQEVGSKIDHIVDDIQTVEIEEHGFIKELVLKSQKKIQADLFVDCTGFRRILSSRVPGEKIIDKSNQLFCNRAVACPIEYQNKELEMSPFTTAHCQAGGWIWKTPTVERIGSGFVYDSSQLTPEKAEDVLEKYWGEGRLLKKGLRHIEFRSYYDGANWRNNCASIGLSSGFVEPLESSGLALITDTAIGLLGRIRKGYYTEADQNLFNSQCSLKYEETFDFVTMHYLNSRRRESFWCKVKEEVFIPESLRTRLEGLCQNLCHNHDLDEGAVFATQSWVNLFIGLGFEVEKRDPVFAKDQANSILINYYESEEKFKHFFNQTNFELLQIRLNRL